MMRLEEYTSTALIIIVIIAVSFFIGKNFLSQFIISLFLVYGLIYVLQKKNDTLSVLKVIVGLLAGIMILQATWPVFSPKVAISYGETLSGSVDNENTYTNQFLELEVIPPIYPLRGLTDCQNGIFIGYDISNFVSTKFSPVSINRSSETTIDICTDNVDGWKTSRITLPIYFTSAQPISYYPKFTPILDHVSSVPLVNENRTFQADRLQFQNYEFYPISILKPVIVKNGSTLWDMLHEDNCSYIFYTDDQVSGNRKLQKITENITETRFENVSLYVNPRAFDREINFYVSTYGC